MFIGSRKHRQKAALSSMALFAKWTTLSLVSLLGCQDWEGQACVPRYLRKVVSKKAASFVRSSCSGWVGGRGSRGQLESPCTFPNLQCTPPTSCRKP